MRNIVRKIIVLIGMMWCMWLGCYGVLWALDLPVLAYVGPMIGATHIFVFILSIILLLVALFVFIITIFELIWRNN